MLKKGARITGPDRAKLATDLRRLYDKGESIRDLAQSSGRSYGFVHRVLSESGVELRGRGGSTASRAKVSGSKAPGSKASGAKAATPRSSRAKAR